VSRAPIFTEIVRGSGTQVLGYTIIRAADRCLTNGRFDGWSIVELHYNQVSCLDSRESAFSDQILQL
jgi:hypothetical protein